MPKETPEENLLRLIENPQEASKSKWPKSRKKRFNFAPPSFKDLKVSFLRVFSKRTILANSLFDLSLINRALIVVSSILLIYLLVDFIRGRPAMANLKAITQDASSLGAKLKTSIEPDSVKLSDYLSQIDARDIFNFIPEKKEEKAPPAKEELAAFTKNLKLVGIIWSRNPQAMIEDKQENKTLLLNEGDKIGKVKLKQILKDKVILSLENEEMELL